jgi:hypothetical protein
VQGNEEIMRRITKCLMGLALLGGTALGISGCANFLINDFDITASPNPAPGGQSAAVTFIIN